MNTQTTVDVERGMLVVRGAPRRLAEIAAELPGPWRWGLGPSLLATRCADNLETLAVTGDLAWDADSAAALAAARETAAIGETNAVALAGPQAPIDPSCPPKTRPYDHQVVATAALVRSPFYGLLMDMGTGKTKCVLDAAAALWREGRIDCLVVLAPNGVHRRWVEDQVPAHLPDWCPRTCVVWSAGAQSAGWRAEVDAAIGRADALLVVAANIEGLSVGSGRMERFLRDVLGRRRALLVVDESSRIKTPGARRTRRAVALGHLAARRAVLTGTPVTRGVENLYSQMRFLSDDVLGLRTYAEFRARYCVTRPVGMFGGQEIIGYRNLDDLTDRLARWTYSARKEDCLDLPPKVYVRREVEMTDEQRRAYAALRDDAADPAHDGEPVANALVRILRLQEVVCGFVRRDGDRPLRIDSRRHDVVADVVEEAGGQVLVWCRFVEDVDRVAERLRMDGTPVATLDGRVAERDRAAVVGGFQGGTYRVLVGTSSTGGVGIDLTAASTVIYYSNSFDAEVRWQSEDRAHRIGQTRSVTYVDLVAPRTVDARILSTLRRRRGVADAVKRAGGLRAWMSAPEDEDDHTSL